MKINQNLTCPDFYHKYITWELNRNIITKYRTGSHYLQINAGRSNNTPRHERLCICGQIQTLKHVVFECILTRSIKTAHYPQVENLKQLFDLNSDIIATILVKIEKELKLR